MAEDLGCRSFAMGGLGGGGGGWWRRIDTAVYHWLRTNGYVTTICRCKARSCVTIHATADRLCSYCWGRFVQ